MPEPPKPPGHGVTRADAQRIVELARQHGMGRVHPLLTCPNVTTGNVYELREAARRHEIKIGSGDLETVREAFRAVMDGLLPKGYPHKLRNPDRKLLARLMREHGVGPVQQALGMHQPPGRQDFEGTVKRFKADPGWADRLR